MHWIYFNVWVNVFWIFRTLDADNHTNHQKQNRHCYLKIAIKQHIKNTFLLKHKMCCIFRLNYQKKYGQFKIIYIIINKHSLFTILYMHCHFGLKYSDLHIETFSVIFWQLKKLQVFTSWNYFTLCMLMLFSSNLNIDWCFKKTATFFYSILNKNLYF